MIWQPPSNEHQRRKFGEFFNQSNPGIAEQTLSAKPRLQHGRRKRAENASDDEGVHDEAEREFGALVVI